MSYFERTFDPESTIWLVIVLVLIFGLVFLFVNGGKKMQHEHRQTVALLCGEIPAERAKIIPACNTVEKK